jgi:hypothetical protein
LSAGSLRYLEGFREISGEEMFQTC